VLFVVVSGWNYSESYVFLKRITKKLKCISFGCSFFLAVAINDMGD